MSGTNPWDANEGKFDVPSSSLPKPPPAAASKQRDDDPIAGYRGVEAIAADLVDAVGIETAKEIVAAASAAVEATEPARMAGPPDVDASHLIQIVERVEVLFAEREALAGVIADVFAFAKGIGLDPKSIRAVVKMRAMDKSLRMEAEAIIEVYRHALGIEGPDFVIALPRPAVAVPPPQRKLTAKEKQYRDTLAWSAASRAVTMQ